MDVLNQNQRKSALWRIVGIGVFILALMGTTVFAMNNHYENQLQTAIGSLTREIQGLKGTNQGLLTEKTDLTTQLAACQKDVNKNSSAADITRQLNECRSSLRSKIDQLEVKTSTIQNLEAQIRALQ